MSVCLKAIIHTHHEGKLSVKYFPENFYESNIRLNPITHFCFIVLILLHCKTTEICSTHFEYAFLQSNSGWTEQN